MALKLKPVNLAAEMLGNVLPGDTLVNGTNAYLVATATAALETVTLNWKMANKLGVPLYVSVIVRRAGVNYHFLCQTPVMPYSTIDEAKFVLEANDELWVAATTDRALAGANTDIATFAVSYDESAA